MGEKGRIRRRLLALSGLVPWLVSLPARAEPRDFGPFDVVGAGVFVGYTFGDKRGIDWGVEGFATRHFRKFAACDNDEVRSGFGPLLRFSALDVSRFAFTGAGHVGGEAIRSFIAADVELGGTLALTRDGSLGGVHTGVTLESIIFNVYARQEWLLRSYSFGGGARFIPTFGLPGFCADGRAFRDDRGDARSRTARAGERFDRTCPEAARWAARTRDECSSILAFLQLALELLDEQAPLELVARAMRSAEQELSHTWAAAALASRFGRAMVVPRSPAPHFRARLPHRQQVARLAHESWVDGCLNEGLAALVAAEEARDATDPEEARISAKIAREEAEHAALAFDVVRWALGQDDTLAPNSHQHANAAPFTRSLLGPPRVRELANHHTASARRRLVEQALGR
jgi:hypothetical protein